MRVARADAGAAGRDDDLRPRVRQALPHDRRDLRRLVLDDGVARDRVSGLLEQLPNGSAAGVVRLGARVAHGQHEAGDRGRSLRFVFERTHDGIM